VKLRARIAEGKWESGSEKDEISSVPTTILSEVLLGEKRETTKWRSGAKYYLHTQDRVVPAY